MNANLAIFAITILGAALRFLGLASESLWLDEGYIYSRITESYVAALTHWDMQWQGYLFALVEKVWCDVFGHSEFSLRFLPAVFGSLAVPALYFLGQILFSRQAALVASLLLAVNPCAIHYSQDARPYTLFLLASILATYFAVSFLHKKSGRLRILFLLAAVVTLYSHPFGVFLLPFLAVLPFFMSRESSSPPENRKYFLALAGAVVLYLPMMVVFGKTIVGKMQGNLHDADFIPSATLPLIADAFSKYFMSSAAAIVLGGIVSLAVAAGFYRKTIPVNLRVPTMLVVCFVLIPWVVSLIVTPIFFFRYTIPALAGVLLLLGWSLESMKLPFKVSFLIILLALSGNSLFNYYTKVDKDPWRQTAERIVPRLNSGDLVIVHPFWAVRPLNYYLSNADSIEVFAPKDFTGLQSRTNDASRVWFIDAYEINDDLKQEIQRTVETSRNVLYTLDVFDSLDINPQAYKVGRISASLYSRMSEPNINSRVTGD